VANVPTEDDEKGRSVSIFASRAASFEVRGLCDVAEIRICGRSPDHWADVENPVRAGRGDR